MMHGRWEIYEGDTCYIDWCSGPRKYMPNVDNYSRYCSTHLAIKTVWGEYEPIVVCNACGCDYAIKPAVKGRNRILLCDDCYQLVPLVPKGIARYGIKPADWVAMYVSQDGRCFINDEFCQGKLTVDHNHETGEIRSLLCENCNMMVGRFESPRAEIYLAYIHSMN